MRGGGPIADYPTRIWGGTTHPSCMATSPPPDPALPSAVPAAGLSWKKFVLELPVAADASQVKREFMPIEDEPLAYFARAGVRFLAARVDPDVRRELGRALAQDATPSNMPTLLAGFAAAGLGHVSFARDAASRYVFRTEDTPLESEAARTPCCHLVLGFVEGLTAGATGRTVLGSETQCRAMGHPACLFVVSVR